MTMAWSGRQIKYAHVKHPTQPLHFDEKPERGTCNPPRFKQNKIVRTLLDTGKLSISDVVSLYDNGLVSQEDLEQLYQLIGYDLSGFCELSFISDEAKDAAEKLAKDTLGFTWPSAKKNS